VGGGGCGPLQPGETRETRFDLFRAYDLDRPGRYTVWVSRADNALSVGIPPGPNYRESKVTVKSNSLEVTVLSKAK
jgi:hypothetical protein